MAQLKNLYQLSFIQAFMFLFPSFAGEKSQAKGKNTFLNLHGFHVAL